MARSITHLEQIPQTTSVEEQEMNLRLERAEKTAFTIKNLEESCFPFSSYEVLGTSNIHYYVEIRSLNEKINSCSCPDYKVNTLNSCKHIEATLNFIKTKKSKGLAKLAQVGSERAEIYLHPKNQDVCIQWPQDNDNLIPVRTLLEPYMSVNQKQLIDPMRGVVSIENILEGTSPEVASKIRISQHLIDWAKDQKRVSQRENDRKEFLADVEAGKRSLQMLSSNLFPYQEQGMLHLAFQGRAILADEMGLGKTIQAIAACELLRRLNRAKRVLVVTPASLKGEWEEQIQRFTGLPTLIVSGTRPERLSHYKKETFFYLVNYEQVRSDFEEIQALINPDIVILDEAQRVKNWQTKTAWAVKQLKSPYAFVLTGTPIENRIEEIYSIMQVVDPKILGPLYKFNQDFYEFDEKGKATGYKNLDQLHQRLNTVVLRRRKKDVEEQLPERTISTRFVHMEDEQQVRYDEYSDKVARMLHILKKRPLTLDEQKRLQMYLACMRMLSDTPYILDEECRECPKLEELEQILTGLLTDPDCKIIIFSEWERMLFLVKELAEKMGINFAWHTGSVPQVKRRVDINRFKEDPNYRLFLSTDSGSTGLNLQVANVVINLDMPWNPAKLEQRIARAWRKNQSRVVQVFNLVTENSIEHRMLSLLSMKQAVADAVLDAIGDLNNVKLPSASRQDFIDKLEQLTGMSQSEDETDIQMTTKKVPEQVMQDILARHSDRIHLFEASNGHSMVVVDKADLTIKQSITESVAGSVEVLDYETYMTLKRLAEAGIIQFTNKDKNVLFQSNLIQANKQDLQKKKMDEANVHFKEAERKLKMSILLKSGGFSKEAAHPAQEAFKEGMEVLKILEMDLDADEMLLKEQSSELQNPEAFIDELSSWILNLSMRLTKYMLGCNR